MSNKIVDSKILLARDYSSLMEWAINTIPKITNDWTDFTIIAPEMIWLSSACYSYDILNYTLDRKYLNNQIRFSRSFDNLLNMCTLNGVSVTGYNSSKILLNLNFDSTGLPIDDTIFLPKGSEFSIFDSATLKSINLVLDEDTTIEFGDNLLTCHEGTYDDDVLTISNFTSKGTYILDVENIAHNTFSLVVDGSEWRKVDDAFLITDNIPSYSIHVHSNNHTLLKLCVGYDLLIGANPITISYLITTGFEGNVGTSSEVEAKFTLIDSYGSKVKDKVTLSVLSSSGGEDALDLAGVRSLLGTTSSDVVTLVTNDDYKNIITQVEYVYNSEVKDGVDRKLIYYIADENIGDYGITDGDITNSIDTLIAENVPVFTEYSIYPITIRPVTLKFKVFLSRNELDITGLETKILDYINDKFSREKAFGGMELNRTEISLAIEDMSPSVSYVLFEYPLADIYCNWYEIVSIDNIEISFERG